MLVRERKHIDVHLAAWCHLVQYKLGFPWCADAVAFYPLVSLDLYAELLFRTRWNKCRLFSLMLDLKWVGLALVPYWKQRKMINGYISFDPRP